MSIVRNVLIAAFLAFSFTACTGITEKSPRDTFHDAAIVTKAKAAFAVDPIVKGTNISVTAVRGDVTLAGTVRNAEEARRAEEIVRSLEHVNSVTNALRVGPG
jgi:osmotically-inducible protein OsmY